jgi:Protein involved in formate dehydrogenase formation
MAAPGVEQVPSPWVAHRRRALALRGQHPFAAELLTLYLALVDVWEDGWRLVRADRPQPAKVAAWATERVLPRVVEATGAAGPEPLASATGQLVAGGGLGDSLATWLAGGELEPVERYLARASLWAPLVALGAAAEEACAEDASPRDDRHCPRCGGLPQLSFRSGTQDRLVSGRRQLACARCAYTWSYSASSCPSCAEATGARRTMYAERRDGPVVGRDADGPEAADAPPSDPPTFPHLRIDACATCQRYLVDVDLGRDARAVPEVDELVALPLDLYAIDRGLSKITPNLMGF